MKKILVLLCMCAGLSVLAGVPRDGRVDVLKARAPHGVKVCGQSAPSLKVGQSDVIGQVLYFMTPYEWNYNTSQVFAADPFYLGWTGTIAAGDDGQVMMDGLYYQFDVPVEVDYTAAKAVLKAGEVINTYVSETVTVGSTQYDTTEVTYIVNEDWFLNNGALVNIEGTIADDGSITFEGGWLYYFETTVTTTRNGESHSDMTKSASYIFRNTHVMQPSGIHGFTLVEEDGTTTSHEVPVYMYNADDNTVIVWNLWGNATQANVMTIDASTGTMTFAKQMVWDREAIYGDFYNATGVTGVESDGNQGTVTPTAIEWNNCYIYSSEGYHVSYPYNVLNYTNGNKFYEDQTSLRGDVDGNGSVNISDVTLLIDYLLNGDSTGVDLVAADCDLNGSIDISDVTALIDYLLSGAW